MPEVAVVDQRELVTNQRAHLELRPDGDADREITIERVDAIDVVDVVHAARSKTARVVGMLLREYGDSHQQGEGRDQRFQWPPRGRRLAGSSVKIFSVW